MRRPGPELPYQLLGGVQSCPGGWLVVGAKLQGISMAPQPAEVLPTFIDLIDHRPAYSVIALRLPIGLRSVHQAGGRSCDVAARKLLGRPRSAAIASPPSREDLAAFRSGGRPAVSAVVAAQLARIAEAYEVIGSYHQRTVFEVHPELSFFQLNGNRPLRRPKHTGARREERRSLLLEKIPGAERALDHPVAGASPDHLADGLALLWTARRIFARAVTRLPELPEWDEEGFRMELVY